MMLDISRALMIGLDKQTVDTDPSQASGLASRFQESMNGHRVTGFSTASIFFFLYFSCFTLVNNIILQKKAYTKIHLQLDKSSNEVEK